MSSRYSAARPSKAGEKFARTHRLNQADEAGPSKKPKFDVRNPSALAPDAPEEDAVLEADVIGGSGAATKRGAVNLDGYDSDSDNEGFDARADERAKGRKGEVDIADAFDYSKPANNDDDDNDDDDEDMFGGEEEGANPRDEASRKKKHVDFQDENDIEKYSVLDSKSGGHISGNFALDPKGKLSSHAMDDKESSDDEDEAALAALEEDIDEEVGAGGKKRKYVTQIIRESRFPSLLTANVI